MAADDDAPSADACRAQTPQFNRMGLRVASIFIVLIASLIGALLPVVLARQSFARVPSAAFFICKFVGTGVIIATAWMHLLAPAVEELGDACVKLRWPAVGGYPWALCVPLMTIMVMLFVEMLASHPTSDHAMASDPEHILARKEMTTHSSSAQLDGVGDDNHDDDDDDDADDRHRDLESSRLGASARQQHSKQTAAAAAAAADAAVTTSRSRSQSGSSHSRKYGSASVSSGRDMAGQLTAIFVLEFGVLFHSVFIGLTLGTTADSGLVVLLVVLVFHQLLEGLGLGSRLADAPWPPRRRWMPYVLALAFALSTPVGVAVALGVRPSEAATQKLVNGIFDAISAGILLYTGLVELLAHEFLLNPRMRLAPLRVQLAAYACVAVGVAIMALLAKWA